MHENINAVNLRSGDYIVGEGLVGKVQVFQADIANREPTPHETPENLPRAVLHARLAKMALDHCYDEVPSKVLVHIGSKDVNFDADDVVAIRKRTMRRQVAA